MSPSRFPLPLPHSLRVLAPLGDSTGACPAKRGMAVGVVVPFTLIAKGKSPGTYYPFNARMIPVIETEQLSMGH